MAVDFDQVEQAYDVIEKEIDQLMVALRKEYEVFVGTPIGESVHLAMQAIYHLRGQRDSYQAVLRGMQFERIKVIGAAAVDEAEKLGTIAALRIADLARGADVSVH
jgi:hypothetical protein